MSILGIKTYYQYIMKKILLAAVFIGIFGMSCVDKKAEQEEKEATELNEKIEAIDKEANQTTQELESLEQEAKELDKSLNELDNL